MSTPKEEENKGGEAKAPQVLKYLIRIYSEVGQMKRGDYLIHVFIEQARQLKCPDNSTVDPIVEVTVINDKKYTTAKDDIGATGLCKWNEHLFFEPKNLTVAEVEAAKIQIKVMDKGYFKDAVIGVYTFDFAYIYFMNKHSLLHQWLALSNPASENFNEVAGYLKLSINISATGDEQIQITDDQDSGKSDESVLMPPSIRPEYYQVRFKFFRAEHLPAMDKNLLGKGSIDAYVHCHYLTSQLKTDVITAKEGTPVDWNCEFLIPCQLPIMSSRIVMKLYDQDPIADEIVGSLLFNLKDCIGPHNGMFFWKNVYGSPLGCAGANTNMMNENPEMASTWKGRILMQVTAEKTDKPVCIMRKLAVEDVERAQEFLKPHEYDIMAEIGQGIALPAAENYKVMIKIADLVIKSDKAANAENTYNRWSYRTKQLTFTTVYQDVFDIGRVYVYLMQGDTPICFFQSEIEEFTKPNPKWKWVEMNPDLAIGKVTDPVKAGLISFKLAIHDKTRDGPINFENFNAWRKPPPKRLDLKMVRAFIFQCRDLPSADSDGQSDPFIKVWDTTKELKQTKVIDDNNNPLFYEVKELQIETSSIEDMPPFIFDIYDKDTLSNDFIARTVIPISQAVYSEGDKVPEPKWYPCKLKPSSPPQGDILVSFSIVESDFKYQTPLEYVSLKNEVDFRETEVEINILGLRDLQSVGILPVKKAFIVFNLKSLVPPDDGRALENIRTQPNAAGANPTINTVIKFKVPLPTNKLFCPRLSCTVHDYIFKGMSQPLIGAFTVPVGDLLLDLIDERQRETAAIEMCLGEIDKIMKDEGVISYTFQASINNNDETFDETSTQITQQLQKAKKSIKVDDDMKKPLLMISEQEESKVQFISPHASPRHTPKSLMGGARLMDRKKTVSNPMKMQKFDKFASGQKTELLKDQKEKDEREKREIEAQRQREQEEFKSTGGDSSAKNIIMPRYELDKRLNVYREVNPPPESLFIGLSWDETPEAKTKHYRRYYPNELENVKEVMPQPTPFQSFELKRGQSRGANKSWFSFGSKKQDESGSASDEQVVGQFKGIVTVQSEDDKKAYAERKADLIHNLKVKLNSLSLKKTGKPVNLNMEKMDTMEGRQKFELQLAQLGIEHLKITQKLADLESDETLRRLLMTETKCIVRVYMLSAYNLSSRDNGSESDPYLIMTLGNKTYNERDIYQLDEPNPEFHKYYDFEAIFPGCPPLVINVVDYDDIFGDDNIGKTTIDLEDRFFSPEWQSIKHKPIEYRNIFHPSTSISQGTVKCWVEIHPTAVPQNEITIYQTAPKPAEEFEVRVVIYDTVDVIMMDAEGTSDVYCRAFFDSREDAKETDTHFRCSDGKASFNYRLLYNVKLPNKKGNYSLNLQLYDRDFFKSNDIIGEVSIDLKPAIMDAALSKRPLGVNKKYFNDYLKEKGYKFDYKDENSFLIPVIGKDEKTGQNKVHGKVRIQIDIYPKDVAERNKVGEARQEPNHSPFLPPPIGRIALSVNPFKMFSQLVGPAVRRKIYCYCCMIVFCALIIMMAPMIAGNLVTQILF